MRDRENMQILLARYHRLPRELLVVTMPTYELYYIPCEPWEACALWTLRRVCQALHYVFSVTFAEDLYVIKWTHLSRKLTHLNIIFHCPSFDGIFLDAPKGINYCVLTLAYLDMHICVNSYVTYQMGTLMHPSVTCFSGHDTALMHPCMHCRVFHTVDKGTISIVLRQLYRETRKVEQTKWPVLSLGELGIVGMAQGSWNDWKDFDKQVKDVRKLDEIKMKFL